MTANVQRACAGLRRGRAPWTRTGGIYTVHDWDEAHFSVIKWSPKDGRAEFGTGNAVNEALAQGHRQSSRMAPTRMSSGYQDLDRSREGESSAIMAHQAGS